MKVSTSVKFNVAVNYILKIKTTTIALALNLTTRLKMSKKRAVPNTKKITNFARSIKELLNLGSASPIYSKVMKIIMNITKANKMKKILYTIESEILLKPNLIIMRLN